MRKFIEKLHFITNDIENLSHVEQANAACQAGAKWIQYRCLTKSDDALLRDINEISAICDDWGTTLIVTDHFHLAGRADIQGFHIEDMEADLSIIKQKLGDEYTLGGSANTLEGLTRLINEGADYLGFGPFSKTTTKPNDLPLLGTQGYIQLAYYLEQNNFDVPVLAVGGVGLADVENLMDTGIFGIAVSGAIVNANDIGEAYKNFKRLID